MAIYRGEGGKTDVVPADGDQEFAGSIIAEKDIHAHGNISADGDITIGGDIHLDGAITGDGSGLENVPTPFLQADDCIYLNNQVITNDYTMPVGKNGMTAGDVTVNGEVFIPEGSDWHIVGDDAGVVSLESLGIPNHNLVTVDETGHLSSFGVTSESPYVGDGSLLTGIPTTLDLDAIQVQVDDNKTSIETNAEAIQVNADAIAAIPGAVDAYTKSEIDAQQSAQDTEIATKISDAPTDGETYARNNQSWVSISDTSGVPDAPVDGQMYGRQDGEWEVIDDTVDAYTKAETNTLLDDKADKSDTYTKSEVNSSQQSQDILIQANADAIANLPEPIDTYTKSEIDLQQESQNSDIAQNTSDISDLNDEIDALTGSIIYKGSLDATTAEAPLDANVGDMWINEYNVSEPATNYPVASGWSPVTEVKYDDKLIKTDTGWDKIESVVGVPSYSAGEIDDLLDEKVDVTDFNEKQDAQDVLIQKNADDIANIPAPIDTYTKAEIDLQQEAQDEAIANKADTGDSYTKDESDTLLDNKANNGDSYLKAETYSSVETDSKLFEKADKSNTYTKTEVDTSQSNQNIEIAKKADKDNTYTKDEVNELIEAGSGAIVGNYKANYPDNVARDPEAGNLYLVNIMSFTNNYDEVTTLYISKTDADGTERDLSQIVANDIINLESANGSGSYIVQSFSDSGAYYEILVDRGDCSGTLAQDDDVTARLEVEEVGTGGIEEAPIDGKQYARQDGDWSEVEATSGGGGEAQPPVAFNAQLKTPTELPNLVNSVVPLESINLDTDNAWKEDHYLVPKDGIYSLQASTYISDVVVQAPLHQTSTMITRVDTGDNSTILARHSNYVGTGSEATKEHGPRQNSTPVSVTCELKKGDKIQVEAWARTHSGGNYTVSNAEGGRTFLSGHMVSSITEDSGGGGPFIFHGTTAVTQPAPYDPVMGQMYFNKVAGKADSSWGLALDPDVEIPVNAVLIYDLVDPGTWGVIMSPNIGGSSGGGDYTPEKMVWEDVKADREFDVEYTNTNDVPLYLSVNTKSNSSGTGRINLTVDGVQMLTVGASAGGTTANVLDSVFTVVPAGSTYIIKAFDSPELTNWHEARMPVAVGTGGKTVGFRVGVSSSYTFTGSGYEKIPFNVVEFDTDNNYDLVNNEFVVKEAGIYNFTSYVQTTSVGAGHTRYLVNGIAKGYGTNIVTSQSYGSNNSIILNLNVGDKVSLGITGDAGLVTVNDSGTFTTCFFSGFKVSAGSASGDSIWTEEDGKAVYDGDIKVNGLTVGKGDGNVLTNTAFGVNALANAEDTNQNTAVGFSALSNITLGGSNTAIGVDAGKLLTVGDNNIIIGNDAQPSESNVSNEVTIGNDNVTTTRLNGTLQVRSNGHNFEINPDSNGEATSVFSGRELRFYVGSRTIASQVFKASGTFNLGNGIEGSTLSGDISSGAVTYRPITGGGIHHFSSDVGGSNSLKSYINETGSLNQVTGFDSRTIENAKPIESALDKVNKLKPIIYDHKGSDSKGIGFVAHELQEVISEAVVGKKDQKKKDGTPFYQGVDITKVIPYLTKAIQELSEKDKLIEKLSARLDELEKRMK